MKRGSFLLAAYYLFPIALLAACVLRIAKRFPADYLTFWVGRWEVIAFWIMLGWLFITACTVLSVKKINWRAIDRKTLVILFFIVLAGFYLRAVVAPKTHRLSMDEDIYLNIAQNIQSSNQALPCKNGGTEFGLFTCNEPIFNKEPNAWPFALSLALNVFGSPESSGRWLDIVLSALTILLVYGLGKEIFSSEVALWGAGLYALLPLPAQWAPTVEPFTFFTFLMCACLLLDLKALNTRDDMYLLPLFPLALLTVETRPEGILFLMVLFIAHLSGKGRAFYVERRYRLFFFFFLVLSLPYALHLNLASGENWGSIHGPKFSLNYVAKNLKDNLGFLILSRRFLVIEIPLLLIGLFAVRKNRLASGSLLPWLIGFFGLYLFFYAGSYNYGADARFSLPIHVPLALLAGLGAAELCRQKGHQAMLIGLVLLNLCYDLPEIRIVGQEGWQSRTDHDFIAPILKTLPENAVIFTRSPFEIMVGGRWGIELERIEDKTLVVALQAQDRPLYFYFDAWCGTPEYSSQCADILRRFSLREVARNKTRTQILALYKIQGEP